MKNLRHVFLCLLVMGLLVAVFAVTASAAVESVTNAEGTIRIDYDTEAFSMHIVNVNANKNLSFEPANAKDASGNTLQSVMDTYKTEVKSVKIDFFARLNQTSPDAYFFYGYTALESVNFAANQRIRMRTTGMFEGCSALTTVWFGDNYEAGCANLTGIRNDAGDVDTNNIIISNIFKGCSALKKVVLPTGSTYTEITSETFAGCTSLEEVTIGSNILIIADDAFEDCESLKAINAEEGSTAYRFAEAKGLLPEEEYVSLWDQKPETDPDLEGYLLDYDSGTGKTVSTNIKWEIYNFGVSTNDFTLYLYIDEGYTGAYADNKLITSPVADTASITNPKGDHPFTPYTSTVNALHRIAIANGIEGIDREAFALLTAVDTIELPSEGFTAMNGSAFRGMSALSTVYTKGNTPEAGVVDLSGVTYIDFSTDNTFYGLSSVEEYRFNPDVEVKVDTGDYMRNTFTGNTSLKALDLSNMELGGIGAYTFQNCTSLEEIYLPANVATYKNPSSDNASFKNNPALKAIYAPVGSTMHTYAMANGYDTIHTADISDGTTTYARITFFPESGRVEIIKLTDEKNRDFYSDQGGTVFFGAYKNLITEVSVPSAFQKFRSDKLFWDLPNLERVCFAPQRILDKSGNIFANCSKLTTVYFGDEADMVEGVADLSKMNADNVVDRFNVFLNGLFLNCSSIKKVVLPAFDSEEGNAYNAVISATTFEGCTSLRTIELNGNIVSIADGAFESCSSLKEIVMNAPISLIGENTFEGKTKGTVIFCQSNEAAIAVNGILSDADISTSSVFAFHKSGMTIPGYQVRTSISETANNGIRTIFAFNTTAPEGFELVEFGSIVAVADNYKSFTENLGYSSDSGSILWYDAESGSFKTPRANIIKTAIYENGAFSLLDTIKYGYDEATKTANFSVTVVNLVGAEQITSELVNSGYEIWSDGENYYVIFTREEVFGYDTISLYKQTLGMLGAGVIELKKDETSPVWNTLSVCAGEAIETDNSAVSAFLTADPLSEGKYIALYATESDEAQNISTLGIDSSIAEKVSSRIFGTNVVYSLPALDTYWEEHIDEKLATLPEGKSFIIYTDTHYLLNGGQNTRKLPALISYVREKTGIETVINLGDPYQKETAKEDAEKVFRAALENDFYNVYGEDGLFAVGNHDANITAYNKLVENAKENGTEAPADYTVLLPDTVLYDATIKHIENKEGIKFDEDMLAIADQLTYADIGGEFTAEQMKNEFIAWVKQHYYYDDTENGIRYIVYNSGNCSLVERYILKLTYAKIIPTQIKFIANALATVPQGEDGKDYDVVLLGHMLGSNEDNNETYIELYKLLSAFKAGRSYTLTYTAPNANAKIVSGIDGSYTVDFTDNGYNGTVFTMSGHWHRDLSYIYQTVAGNYMSNQPYESYNYVSDDAVFYIGINNDNYSDTAPATGETEETDPKMTMGDATENCFSIITITPEGNIELTRIGAGADRSFNYNN